MQYSTINMKHIKRDLSLKAWVRPCGWTKGLGQRPKFNLCRIWSCYKSHERGWACRKYVANTLSIQGGWGGGGSKLLFFRTYSCCISNKRELRMHLHAKNANILSLHTPSTPQGRGVKVKNFFFLKVVMLHIKLM